MQNSAADDEYRGRPVKLWKVLEGPMPYASPERRLRISVTYADGKIKLLAPAFSRRDKLDAYVGRFLPELVGKEVAPVQRASDSNPLTPGGLKEITE